MYNDDFRPRGDLGHRYERSAPWQWPTERRGGYDRRSGRDRRHWRIPRRAQRRTRGYHRAYGRPHPHFETPPSGAWYSGRGEAYRYGTAPVAYGREHTYDYHLGDRFGYGPDFYRGEARVRYWPRAEHLRRRG